MFQMEIVHTNYINITEIVNEKSTTVSVKTVIDMKNPFGIFNQLKNFL